MFFTEICWVKGCSFVRNGTPLRCFWLEFSENVCCNLTEFQERISLEFFQRFFLIYAPILSKIDFTIDILLWIFPNRIQQLNLKCTSSPTFSRKYPENSIENPEKRNITYTLNAKFYSEPFMSDSSPPSKGLQPQTPSLPATDFQNDKKSAIKTEM